MKTVRLKREFKDAKECLGTITCETFTASTLELPDKNNENEISCIPIGKYVCKYTKSNRLSALKGEDFFTYEVFNVPNRAGIRIHSANYFHDLKGCIALGVSKIDLDKDGELDITGSRDTIKKFEEFMKKEPFILTIE
jgi:Family of unknown function (DUF5675)